ncbi:LamG domain-containing protein, partial [Candidatus Woesearchaeota archaeon]|nr:LamG domain-containing protein [Candidatus Woesearchaeota archaeon]
MMRATEAWKANVLFNPAPAPAPAGRMRPRNIILPSALLALFALLVALFYPGMFAGLHSPTGAVTLDTLNTYYVNESVVLDAGLYAYDVAPESAAIVIASDNVTVDCSGATIAGSGNGTGILNDGHVNVVIKDCFVQGFTYGLKTIAGATDHGKSSFIGNLVQNIYEIGQLQENESLEEPVEAPGSEANKTKNQTKKVPPEEPARAPVAELNTTLNESNATLNESQNATQNVSQKSAVPVMILPVQAQAPFNMTPVINAAARSVENSLGKIKFRESEVDDISGVDACVVVESNLVGLKETPECAVFNHASELQIKSLPYAFTPVVLKNGGICLSPFCNITSYENGVLTFNVSGFSNFSTKSNANLSIYDFNDSEGGSRVVFVSLLVNFTANYTNVTSGLPIDQPTNNSNCTISFNVSPSGPFNMSWSAAFNVFFYNRTFSAGGNVSWNVSCEGRKFEPLNASDSIAINSIPTQGTPAINSTLGTNRTSENITVYNTSTVDVDGDVVKNIVDWRLNGSSFAVLNMPFEAWGSNGTHNENDASIDYSAFKTNGTVIGGALWNRTGGFDGRGAYLFDGVDDYISIPNAPNIDLITYNMTISLWTRNLVAPSLYDVILMKSTSGAWTDGYGIFYNNATEVNFFISTYTVTAGKELNVTNWNHIVGRYNGTHIVVFVNGVEGTATARADPVTSTTGPLEIGRGRSNTYNINGLVDDVRIYNRSLSNAEILALYNNRTDLIVSQELAVGQNWSACITPNDGFVNGQEKCSANLTIRAAQTGTLPRSSSFAGASTDFDNVADLTAVTNLVLDNVTYGIIRWGSQAVNVSGMFINGNITLGKGSVNVNVSTLGGGLHESFNSSANVTLRNVSLSKVPVVRRNGSICLGTTCNITFFGDGGNISFNVSGFSNFSVSVNSNLSIYDSNDSQGGSKLVFVSLLVNFTANYTNVTNGAPIDQPTNASNCTIAFNVSPSGPFNMSWSAAFNVFFYNRTFSAGGNVSWNVSCEGRNFEPLNASDSIAINTIPTHGTPVVNSTLGLNRSTENITVYNVSTADVDGDIVKNIVDWRLNGSSFAVLNMPFEAWGSNGTQNENNVSMDYSGFGNNGTVFGGAVWNRTGGFDGRGTYNFDGVNDYIAASKSASINITKAFTVTFWMFARKVVGEPGLVGTGISRGYQCTAYTANNIVYCYSEWAVGGNSTNSAALGLNVWKHIAFTWDGTTNTNSMKMYVNGALTSQASLKLSSISSWGPFTIGKDAAAYFNGSIDDVRIYNRSLSMFQIRALFENRTDLIVWNETLRGENWSACITPNDGFTNGAESCSTNLTVLSTAPTQGTPVINSTLGTNLSSENITVYNVSTVDVDGDVVKNIVNWRLNGSSIAVLNMPFEAWGGNGSQNEQNASIDYSGFRNNGTVFGGAVWNRTGGFDGRGAYQFDGFNDRITLPWSSTVFDTINNTGTFAAWVKPVNCTGQSGNLCFIANIRSTSAGGLSLFYNGGTNVYDLKVGNGTATVDLLSNGHYGDWTFIAGTWNSTHVVLYVNGTQVASNNLNSNANGSVTVIDFGSLGTIRFWNGTIDEVKLWNRDL